MEAPNHIFLHGYPGKDFLCKDWNIVPRSTVVRGKQTINFRYIREYAIIDMLEDAIKNLSDGSLAGYYESKAYQDIIEKIKEL